MNLEVRTNKCCAVINADIDTDKLQQFTIFGCDYYCILHDKDYKSDGVLKTRHYHLILVRNIRSRLKWFLTRIATLLEINENQISVMECDNLTASVQYLIHKNDSDKAKYYPFDIISNIHSDYINAELEKDLSDNVLTFESLSDIFISCAFNKIKIMQTIGLGRYNAYRATINEYYDIVYKEYKANCDIQNCTEQLYDK